MASKAQSVESAGQMLRTYWTAEIRQSGLLLEVQIVRVVETSVVQVETCPEA